MNRSINIAIVVVVLFLLGLAYSLRPTATFVKGDSRFVEYPNNLTCVYAGVSDKPTLCEETQMMRATFQYH